MQKIILRSLFVAFVMLAAATVVSVSPAAAQVAVGISVGFGPPAIPVYDQPACPGDGYYWTPGYWAWDADVQDYYWVPGTWVEPPDAGLLWTPGYWGWNDAAFVWNDGYWGPTIGFYGGINYGFGYFGDGFVGGRWDGGHFFYNTAVWHVDRTVVRNVYENRVTIVNNNHVSFNGGNGGINARANAEQEAARNEHHVEAVAAQRTQRDDARGNQELRASANHGKPPIAATGKAGAFNDHVEKAKEAGGSYNPPANRGNAANNANADRNEARATNDNRANNDAARTNTERTEPNAMTTNRATPSNNTIVHPKDMPAYEKPAAPNTGNAKMDQKYSQQQDKLAQQQDKQRQQLQARQDKEHQQYSKQQADETKNQALEQKHTQQTQQLQQRQQTAQQHLQQRQAPPAHEAAPSGGHAEEPKK
jgi:WXXGXW repeat (2 copies)